MFKINGQARIFAGENVPFMILALVDELLHFSVVGDCYTRGVDGQMMSEYKVNKATVFLHSWGLREKVKAANFKHDFNNAY